MNIKYKLRYKIKRLKSIFIKLLYKKLYKIDINMLDGTMKPLLGKGEFVSVYRKKDIIEIKSETEDKMVRIIPYQSNHGIMVECWISGKNIFRSHLYLNQLIEPIRYASNFDIFVDYIKYDKRIRKEKIDNILNN